MTQEEAKAKIATLCNVSRETIVKLETYAALLERWNPKINLVSKTTLKEKWQRHFLDSAQVWPHVPDDSAHLVDVGSGAGFAGLVLAIIAEEKKPSLKVTLIESDMRKCAFMRSVVREIGLEVNIVTQRLESVTNMGADVMTARALAPISQLLAYSENILAVNGCCLFLKGEACDKEVVQAQESWNFVASKTNSITHNQGCILKITGITHAG